MAQNKVLMHSPLRSLEFYCFQPRSAEQKLETATTGAAHTETMESPSAITPVANKT